MNVQFYKKLLSFRTYSKSETQIEFRDWLRVFLHKNFENIETKLDQYGNLYVEKGKADVVNCVVAHLDINQRTKSDNIYIANIGEWILGIDKDTGLQIGLGHDDKTGVYFAIKALSEFDNIKAFFPLDEEIGCVGSKNSDPTFFENVGFMVQLDRRGSSDISNYTNGNDVVTKETEEEFKDILEKYNYKFCRCVATDVGYLVGIVDIQGVNISCGYYDEHSDKEVLSTIDYDNAERFALSILKQTDGKVYTITQKKYVAPSYNNYRDWEGNGWGGSKDYGKSSTNSSIGSPLTIMGGKGTNANSHLIDRTPKQKTLPLVIDGSDNKAQYVDSSKLFTVETQEECVPTIEKTIEEKSTDFQFRWHSGEADLTALEDTQTLIHGYKQIVNYLIKETATPDEDCVDILINLQEEVLEVEILGPHDLKEVKEYIQTNINLIESFLKKGQTV